MKKFIFISAISLVPSIALAQTPQTFSDVVQIFIDIILLIIPVVTGIAVLVFFWGLAKFILHAGDEKGRAEGKQVMMWGIIALFIMVSVWGILTFLYSDFGFNTIYQFGVPTLPTGAVELFNVG